VTNEMGRRKGERGRRERKGGEKEKEGEERVCVREGELEGERGMRGIKKEKH